MKNSNNIQIDWDISNNSNDLPEDFGKHSGDQIYSYISEHDVKFQDCFPYVVSDITKLTVNRGISSSWLRLKLHAQSDNIEILIWNEHLRSMSNFNAVFVLDAFAEKDLVHFQKSKSLIPVSLQVSLRLQSETISPETITNALNLSPTSFTNIGDFIEPSQEYAKISIWKLAIDDPDILGFYSADLMVRQLHNLIGSRKSIVGSVLKECEAGIVISLVADSPHIRQVFTNQTITLFAEYGLPFFFDIYFD